MDFEGNASVKTAPKSMDKRAHKKAELIESALQSLSRLGYSRCNLRAIASDAGVSLGTIHYYFKDKDELLLFCVLQFKENFSAQLREILKSASLKGQHLGNIAEILAGMLSDSIEHEGEIRRLWYDFRTQAMYNDAFLKEVICVENELFSILDNYFQDIGAGHLDGRLVYFQLDAVYRHWLVAALDNSVDWKANFKRDFCTVFASLTGDGTASLDHVASAELKNGSTG